MKNVILLLVLAFSSCNSNKNKTAEGLLYKKELENGKYAFFNEEGKKVLGDYFIIYTDTMKDCAFVYDSGDVLIDRKGNTIYHIFRIDNGPDYTSEGY